MVMETLMTDETFVCQVGETFAHVENVPDGLVHVDLWHSVTWFEIDPRLALRLAYLLTKYAVIAWWKK